MSSIIARIRSILASEVVLGTLITILSIGTAYVTYESAMADSDQNKYEIQGMQALNDGNTTYLEVNQNLAQDFNYYDNWYTYTVFDGNEPKAEYYLEQMSDGLATLATSDQEFTEADWNDYMESLYAEADQLFARSKASLKVAKAWDEKGDTLQLVILYGALGIAFAAWAALLKEEGYLRPLFAVFAVIALVMGLITYFGIPPIPNIDIPADPFATE